MADKRWQEMTESELEHLLVDRWLYRGGVLAIALVFAILITVVGSRGVQTAFDQALVGALIVAGLISAGVFVFLREQDSRIYRELRQRRLQERDNTGGPSG